jgi:glyoxylase-like metal-dependent hydrolase (beta-lactamase superfamily II)
MRTDDDAADGRAAQLLRSQQVALRVRAPAVHVVGGHDGAEGLDEAEGVQRIANASLRRGARDADRNLRRGRDV